MSGVPPGTPSRRDNQSVNASVYTGTTMDTRTLATNHPPPSTGYETICCMECYNPKKEKLEYDYNYDDTKKAPQPYPRIRERGEYYVDSFNDQPWSWTFGTNENVRGPLVSEWRIAYLIFCRTESGSIPETRRDLSCRRWCGC